MLFCVAGTALCDIPTCLCGRRSTFASFSQDELQFSWQAQHVGDLCRLFAGQAQHSTLYTPHSTLYTSHSTLYTPHFTLYTLHSTLHTLHSTLQSLLFTLHTLHFTLHTLHPTLFRIPQSTVHWYSNREKCTRLFE